MSMKKINIKKLLIAASLLSLFSISSFAADYIIDYKGAHASINFKVKHLGYSWLTGRFNKFDGTFSYDNKNLNDAKININIDTASVDSNHAERDKHIRSDDFLDVKNFGKASFTSTKVIPQNDDEFQVIGILSLHGVEKEITINAKKIGEGKDPWGGYRAGFSGTTSIQMKDFGLKKNFGEVLFELHIEGIKQ